MHKSFSRPAFHVLIIVLLTALTQLGGLAWLLSRFLRRKIFGFFALYIAFSVASLWVAPLGGRVATSCASDSPLQVQSWFYCITTRTYVQPELADVLEDAAAAVEAAYPGTETLMLDGSLPFVDGFPLLPHLSHDDGRKADLAFYYRDGKGGYLPGRTKSPIGFFVFEDGPTDCRAQWPTLRWYMGWLQPYWPSWEIDEARTAKLIQVLAADSRVGKILLEPHLKNRLKLDHPKIRFQGCRAARHDDHIHMQLQ